VRRGGEGRGGEGGCGCVGVAGDGLGLVLGGVRGQE